MAPALRTVHAMHCCCLAALFALSASAGAQTMNTIVGNGQAGFSGDGGQATTASINFAQGIAYDGLGNLYVSDRHNHRIRKVDTNGNIRTIAGSGVAGFADGPALQARFDQPRDIVADAVGNLYVNDRSNNRIRRISTAGVVTTVAGGGTAGVTDGVPATSATLAGPWGIALDGAGNLYISDTNHYLVRKVTPDGFIHTIAGNGLDDRFPRADGPALQAALTPFGIVVDVGGDITVVDNNRLRRIDAATGDITTIAGNGMEGYSGDGGPASQAMVSADQLAIDPVGNLYLVEYLGYVRRIDTNGVIHRVAGTGVPGFAGDGGPAIDAQVVAPADIAIDSLGRVAFVDIGTHRVRSISASPPFMTAALVDFVQSVDRPAWLMNDFTRELNQSLSAPQAGACALLGITSTRAQVYRAVRLLTSFDGTRIAGDAREIAQERDCRWAQ